MTSVLSPEQRQALKQQSGDTPLRILDEATQSSYVLLRSADYERVRALFEEDPFDVTDLGPLIDEVAEKEGWGDPEMDAYNDLDPRCKP